MFLKPSSRCQEWEELCTHPLEAPWVHRDASFFPFPGMSAMQNGTAANPLPRLGRGGQPDRAAESLVLDGHECRRKAMTAVIGGEKTRTQGSDPSHFNS